MKGGDPRAGAAFNLHLGREQGFAQFGQRTAAGQCCEEEAVGPQAGHDLGQRAGQVVDPMQDAAAQDGVE